mgnify:CR=1 FL=1
MTRSLVLQEVRQMRFEELYERRQRRTLTMAEAAEIRKTRGQFLTLHPTSPIVPPYGSSASFGISRRTLSRHLPREENGGRNRSQPSLISETRTCACKARKLILTLFLPMVQQFRRGTDEGNWCFMQSSLNREENTGSVRGGPGNSDSLASGSLA